MSMLNRASWQNDAASAVFMAVLFACIVLLQPVFFGTYITNVDHVIQLRWTIQFSEILASSPIPRWAPAAHGNLGEPSFLYYQPLFFYCSSLLAQVLGSVQRGMELSLLLSNAAVGLVAYLWLRADIGNKKAVVVGCLLQLLPTLFFLHTVIGAYPWVFSAPFALVFLLESSRSTPRWRVIAISLGLCILAHILSAFMVLMLAGTFSVGRYALNALSKGQNRDPLRSVAYWLLGVLLGLALASFYLVPAMTLQPWVNPQGWVDQPSLDWRRGFIWPTFTYAQFGYRWFLLQVPLPLLALLMSVAGWWLARGQTGLVASLVRSLAALGAIGLVLSSELAYPLYEASGSFQRLQQPYRFLVPSIMVAATAYLIGMMSWWCERAWGARLVLVLPLLAMLALQAAMQYTVHRDQRLAPTPDKAMSGVFGQPEYQTASRGANWRNYLERGGFNAECLRREVICSEVEVSGNDWSALLVVPDKGGDVQLVLPRFAFPTWAVSLNGQDQEWAIDKATGLIKVNLSPGRWQLAVRWKPSAQEQSGLLISLFAVVLLLLIGRLKRLVPES